MKSTLFNTILGCLAALSLAGCGNSSKGDGQSSSSSVPGLLSPGNDAVTLSGMMSNTIREYYTIKLERTGKCTINVMGVTYSGQWQDLTESSDCFKISFVGSFEGGISGRSLNPADSVELHLPEGGVTNYRGGMPVSDAWFSVEPFTYTLGYSDYTADKDNITVTPE